jgi:transcriptional regulator with XRE-family HTH domain
MSSTTRRPARRQTQRTSISDQLRAAVEATGQPDNALALKAGLDPSALSRFMAGRRSFKLDTAEKLCALLNLGLAVGVTTLPKRQHEPPRQRATEGNQSEPTD